MTKSPLFEGKVTAMQTGMGQRPEVNMRTSGKLAPFGQVVVAMLYILAATRPEAP